LIAWSLQLVSGTAGRRLDYLFSEAASAFDSSIKVRRFESSRLQQYATLSFVPAL